jgi:hypothetical protein
MKDMELVRKELKRQEEARKKVASDPQPLTKDELSREKKIEIARRLTATSRLYSS